MKKIILPLSVLAVFILASCDNKNIFGKFHKAGSSSSTEVLLNDANAALEEDNPAKAKEIADKILAKEPGNSEALEISATAGLQEAGFDLGNIITTVMGSGDAADANSILEAFENMDLNNVASAISDAVEKLGIIAGGKGDGAIPAGDVSVNLNLGILELLDAAITIIDVDGDGVIQNDDDDVIQIDENYDVKIKVGTGTPKAVSDLTADDINALKELNYVVDDATVTIAEKLTGSVEQISSAVEHLIIANEKAGIVETGDDTSSITDMKKSIDEDLKPKLDAFLIKLSPS